MVTNISAGNITLATLPLEIRYLIYDFASKRHGRSHLILKEYLEKLDLAIENPTGIAGDGEHDHDNFNDEPMQDEADVEDEEDEVLDAEADSENDDEQHDEVEGEGEDHAMSTAPVSTVQTRNYGRATVYRYMLPIINISRCPPPLGLLQTCKQFEVEATEYHRNKAILTIDVNAAFQHHSFFTETMEKFLTNAFSPLEHIRKLHLVLTWDSEWLREKTEGSESERELDPERLFFVDFYFSERVGIVCNILEACPELREVKVDWHDTEDTPKARNIMIEQLAKIMTTISAMTGPVDPAQHPSAHRAVKYDVQEHFSIPGTKHALNSPLALRRSEFDHLLLSNFAMR